jgi:hypothetical protein
VTSLNLETIPPPSPVISLVASISKNHHRGALSGNLCAHLGKNISHENIVLQTWRVSYGLIDHGEKRKRGKEQPQRE